MEVTIDFFLLLLLLHIIGDFYLQSEKMCENKRQKGIKSKCLYLHLGIITLVFAAPAICCHTFIPWFALIILSHSVIDIGKSYFEKKYPRYTLYYFFGDQLLHWAILAICASALALPALPFQRQFLLLILGFALLFKPTNILITLVLRQLNVTPRTEKTLPSAGHLIGNIERILTFVLVLLEQYSAIGFLIAAKSIMRFRDNKQTTVSTEYVLCGTLLSIGCAFITGICIRYFDRILTLLPFIYR
ncbi:DUF3307 domain-containing protein [Bacteroides stercorirosoris]|uniref:DUF3307 domain-containing protein n=2 Tax=Bacteroides stercorirosoris TaxID=871324 RepID=A0A413H579_9BACE|nr:DUF3307 domain-containing protein [Bacteroides stercorirosoris]RGX78487.1 DUF3307 domain-containing protein [Bacteroides stercorirosoris]